MMMTFKQLTVLAVAALLVAFAPLRASTQAQAVFNVDFSTLLWAGQSIPYEVFYLDAHGVPQPVSLQSARRSKVFSYRGSSPLVFVRKEQGAGGETLLHEVGRVNLSSGMPRTLVLFVARPNGQGMNLMALDDSAESFPPGSYKVINATGSALDLSLGQAAFHLPAGAQHVHRLSERAKDNAVDVVVSNGGQQALFAGAWPHFLPLRTLVFFHAENGSTQNGVEAFIVSDVVLPVQ